MSRHPRNSQPIAYEQVGDHIVPLTGDTMTWLLAIFALPVLAMLSMVPGWIAGWLLSLVWHPEFSLVNVGCYVSLLVFMLAALVWLLRR